MFKNIKLYFQMKKLNRQMSYELLSKLYLFAANTDKYFEIIKKFSQEVSTTDSHEFTNKFIQALTQTVGDTAKKEKE